MNNYALASDVTAGTAVTGEYPHFERILIKTGEGGCTLQLRWAQNTSDGTATQVDKGSYIMAYKL